MRGVAERLAARGDEVHVLTRGDSADEVRAGVRVRRAPAAAMPYDLAFPGWVVALNEAMGAAGRALAAETRFNLFPGHN